MGHRNNKLNMSHAFTPYLFFCNLHTATVANDPFVTDAFVLAAMTFPVLHRSKDALAE